MKFGPGILGVEPPVDGGSGGVALPHQGLGFPPERLPVGEPLPQAAAGQYAELDFRHVQPTAVLRVVGIHRNAVKEVARILYNGIDLPAWA